ncbi:3-hydroxybutyryl-CoA dehydrogenase [Streptomyces sp. MP131-18]|uniref:3-hydroxybutyryl-CoA dehydrogenase n=1 Tax=Streptomyces sp. MP131-18 TaxID=1857892 RepID=UPI0009A22314|nr:3-hydroxybutyryl-CoA dehydrogenase [Streptomyces sp. MP131-18]ONK13611.1 3-hydroxybutyryl-CoA dehydrogenase [Streptomyces sp. MP131-18]
MTAGRPAAGAGTDGAAPQPADGGADFARVGIVGCGLMGSGIAEVCAKAGLDVRVAVTGDASARRGRERIAASLDRALGKGRITEAERERVLGRITLTTAPEDLADRQLVIEAVREDEATKAELFTLLDKVVADPDAVLASNTSSLSVMRLARATNRPGKVLGTHFFSPVPVLPLVEITGSLLTEPAVTDRVTAFVTETLGKQVVHAPDRAGFVVNALLVPYIVSAVRMAESGFAEPEVIDRGMRAGCAHPMGPLELADMIGLDVVLSVAEALHAEFREPHLAPPPLLRRMVEGNLLGRKTGRGFYPYG